ncbi:uncharacterized protein LOC135372055 [Ornithodoros turicata]|uniref:uncharacterized protein LOC135372055 n=1 Tax=Ornithodoros turicata TaxID=34597 RepID=UPI003138F23A
MEELFSLRKELDLQKCCSHGTREECILPNKLLLWNKVLWCCGVYLTETEPGVLTLFSTRDIPITSRNAASLEILLRIIGEHDSIKYVCFRRVDIGTLKRILGSLGIRSDVREFILECAYFNEDMSPTLGSYAFEEMSPAVIKDFEDFQFMTTQTIATMILSTVRKASSLEVFHLDEPVKDDVAVELGMELAKKRSLKTLSLGPRCTDVSFSYIFTLHAMRSADKQQACNLNSLTLCALCIERRGVPSYLLPYTVIANRNMSRCLNHTGTTDDQSLLDDEVLMLANALSGNSNIEVLVLRDVRFSLGGAAALSQLMVTNTALRTIDISGSSLGTDECIALADGLRLATVLKEFIMEECYLTLTGAIRMCEAVRENKSCITVSFGEICSFRNQMTRSDYVELALTDPRGKIRFFWDACSAATIICAESLLMQPQHVNKIVLNGETGHDFPADGFCAFLEQEGTLVDELHFYLSDPAFNLVRKLAECLQRRNGIQALTLTCYEEYDEPAREVLRLLATSLEKNTTLSALHLVSQTSDVIHCFARVIRKNKCLNEMTIRCDPQNITIQEMEQHMECNYAITSFKLPTASSRDEKLRMESLAARNRVLQDRSLHFMSEDVLVKKCWMKAFELTRGTETLRRAIMSKLKKSQEEAQFLIDRKQRYIRDHYFRITAVCKGRIVCNASPTGATQLDDLHAECLSHITGYLSISDVV